MIAHRIAEQLRKGRGIFDANMGDEHRFALADEIAVAEKFYFDCIPFEPAARPAHYGMPKLSANELEMFRLGLIPLPADVCWFEFILANIPSGLLIEKTDDPMMFNFTRFDFVNGSVVWMPIFMQARIEGTNLLVYPSCPEPDKYKTTIEDDVSLGHLIVYMCLMLLSRTTELRRVSPSRVTNQILRSKGRAPLTGHTIVSIVPQRYVSEERNGHGAPGAHKRLHWRRSHIRHFDHPTGKATFVAFCACCKQANQWITAIPRFLVGKRELGEVTHDYRVNS